MREKYLVATVGSFSLIPLCSIISSTFTVVGLHSKMTPTKCLAFQVPSDLFPQQLQMLYDHYLPPNQ
jgi:hypothetical protein